MTPLDWALELSSRGYCPVPVVDKKPTIAWKKIGLDRRRPTDDEIHQWFSNGSPNIGVLTGRFHGLTVVDGDSQEAVEYIQAITGGSPMRVVTSKGKHFYFRHSGFATKSVARIVDDPPVDIRADGGLIIAPGSVHHTGLIYMLDDECDLVSVKDLPPYNNQWFPEKIAPIPTRKEKFEGNASHRAQRYLDKIPGAGSGLRNQSAYRAAAAIGDFGVSEDDGLALLSEWNMRNDPPIAQNELNTIVHSALVSSRRTPIGWRE